jgi:hypothetical protein
LVSARASGEGLESDAPFGSSAKGVLTYDRDGRMTAIITHSRRKPLSGDYVASPTDERAEAFATSFAYAGRYSLVGDEITHHVEVSSVENWVNTDLVRSIRFERDRLILRTPPMSIGGKMQITELIWERNAAAEARPSSSSSSG